MAKKDEYEWVVNPSGETVVIKGNVEAKLRRSCEKELKYVISKESELQKSAMKPVSALKRVIEQKLPDRVHSALCSAFFTAFNTVFEKGNGVIGKTFNHSETVKDHMISDYAVRLKGDHKELKRVRRRAGKTDTVNSAISTVEGVGLGLLGIGLPDLVLFISLILKGIYEKSTYYGHDYTEPRERYFILKCIETSLSRREDWIRLNSEVDGITVDSYIPTDEELKEQIRRTADACALDMLANKFIQGLPIVGTVGGLTNPVYYGKILRYVKLKYHKRYLLGLLKDR